MAVTIMDPCGLWIPKKTMETYGKCDKTAYNLAVSDIEQQI